MHHHILSPSASSHLRLPVNPSPVRHYPHFLIIPSPTLNFLRDLLKEAKKDQDVSEDKLIEYTDTMDPLPLGSPVAPESWIPHASQVVGVPWVPITSAALDFKFLCPPVPFVLVYLLDSWCSRIPRISIVSGPHPETLRHKSIFTFVFLQHRLTQSLT
ncbi:Calbindin-32 [Portunus trituberculatus]|uniref:Calbindin-32 n=1 Tax=Portunus trituberculatus TaxID=210409 RepID=A0A5B7DRM8_PORTR|nr:Calbindin-32 [Portunus trituberculatus]